MLIRKYHSTDCRELSTLFYNTVHSVNAKDYTSEQLDVWATGNVDLEAWNSSFLEHYTVVAVNGDLIVGFGDIDKTGYLDSLEQAVIGTIVVHASITAKPFFEKHGYVVVKEQQIERQGILLTNFVMKKQQ